jgi:Late exocytosis, associated with Golgi transport
LKGISDEELRAIAGTDAALYIVFNRYVAIFFFFITIFNFIVFLPIYTTGDPLNKSDI